VVVRVILGKMPTKRRASKRGGPTSLCQPWELTERFGV